MRKPKVEPINDCLPSGNRNIGLVLCTMMVVVVLCLAPSAIALNRIPYLGIVSKGRDYLLKAGVRTAYAVGDFNGDGIKDLAVGIPYASIADKRAAGKVVLILGNNNGLSGVQIEYHQGASDEDHRIPGDLEAGDLTGFALAAGDFNGDGIDDLAVGAPGEDLGDVQDAGAVFVGLGHAASRNRTGGLSFMSVGAAYRQDGVGPFDLPDRPHTGDMAGFSLAAGNFNGDMHNGHPLDDLAIGIPGEDVRNGGEEQKDAGAVAILQGRANGLDATFYPNLFTRNGQGRYDLYGTPHPGEMLGFSLAAGNFNGDLSMNLIGYDDLAIGSPGRTIDGKHQAGSVCVALGSGSGLDGRLVDGEFSQGAADRFNLRGSPTNDERTGFALAAADFDGDGYDDLAIGVPGETVDGHASAGAVVMARGGPGAVGTSTGLTGLWYLAQFTRSASDSRYDLPGSAQSGDMVGFSLAAGDFNYTVRYPRADLAIGAPGANGSAGAVFVKYGSGTGGIASAAAPRHFAQSVAGADDLYGNEESGDLLGLSVAAGAIGSDMAADLFISVPGETVENAGLASLPDRRFRGIMADSRQMLVDGFTEVLQGESESGPVADDNAGYFWFKRHTSVIWISPRCLMDEVRINVEDLAHGSRARVLSQQYWVEPYPPGVTDWVGGYVHEDALRGEVDLEVHNSFGTFDGHVSLAAGFSTDRTDLVVNISYVGNNSILGSSKSQFSVYKRDMGIYPWWVVLLPDGGLEIVY